MGLSMVRLFRSVLLAAVVVPLVLVTTAATHRSRLPARWSADVVRVSDRSGWGATVVRAVEQWNAAEVGVRFELVGDGEPADVHVVADPARLRRFCEPRGCDAFSSTVGPSRHRRTDVVLDEPSGYEHRSPTAGDVRLVVHELGHTLGLDHADGPERCAVMLPDVALAGCGARGGRSGAEGRPVCGPFASDVRTAAALYGGPGVPREYCVAPLSR
jgi:hypothetical protein